MGIPEKIYIRWNGVDYGCGGWWEHRFDEHSVEYTRTDLVPVSQKPVHPLVEPTGTDSKNVYAIKGCGLYSGGMIIVAASTEKEAVSIAVEHKSRFRLDFQNYEDLVLLPVVYNGASKVLEYHETGE